MRHIHTLVALLAFFLLAETGKGQLLVNPSTNATQLVTALLGPGITVANATMTCPDSAASTFTAVATNMGLSAGVLLTSGSARNAVGPNSAGGTTTGNFSGGDPNLDAIIAPLLTQDACALEFDVTPICDTIQISYVFGSEEYDEYVCASFNDVFGFFISGPGIVGTQNIAIVPGTATPVAINTVNIGAPGAFGSAGPNCITTNSAFYTSNAGGATIEYDGFTVPLIARSAVIPCSTYHIKLAIADVGDASFDSGVFLESGGIKCSSSVITLSSSLSAPNAGGAVEGCVDGYFEFTRQGDTTVAQAVTYTIGGSATPGVDYTGLTGTVNFAPNQSFASLTISAVADALAEGQESIFVIVFDTLCGTPFSDTAYIFIQDELVASAGPNQSICVGDTANLGAAAIPTFSYTWTPATGLTTPNSSTTQAVLLPPGSYDYILNVVDTNNCTGDDTVNVLVNIIPTSPFSLATVTCINQAQTIAYTGNAGPSATYNWNFGGGTVISGSGQGPYQVSWPTPGLVSVSLEVTAGICVSPILTQDIEVRPRPTLAPTHVDVSCFGFGDGSISANPANGTPGYTFTWSPGPSGLTGSIANNLVPGNYTMVVTDALGCRDTAIVPIVQPTQLANSFTFTPILCFNGTGTITAHPTGGNSSYTYLWSSGATTATATGLTVGTHTVTITDATTGLVPCQIIQSFTLQEPTQLTGTIGNQIASCDQSNGTATVAAFGAVPPYQYLWSNGGTGTSIFNLAPGNYTCTITDQNGCTLVLGTTVGEVPSPTVSAIGGASFCEGDGGVQISASGAGGTPGYSYTWWCAAAPCGLDSINDNDPLANPSSTQYYYVQVTDINGCTSNLDSVLVTVLPKPIVDAGADRYLCGDSAPCQILTPIITGAPGPYLFNWMPSVGLNSTTIMNPCARPDTTTPYTLVVTAGNGCSSDYTTTDTLSTVVVHVNPIPVANAGLDLDICLGESVMIPGIGFSAGPAYQYQWSPTTGLSSATVPNPIASPTSTTEYTMVVTSNGCPSYGDMVTVNVHTNPTVDAGPDREICLGASTPLDAQASGDSTATYTYSWSPALGLDDALAEDPNASPVSTTLYSVVATSNHGCESPPASVLVTLLPTPVANAGPDVAVCAGTSLLLNGSFSYTSTLPAPVNEVYFSWTPGQTLNDTTLLQPTAAPSVATFYYLTVMHNLCATTDSVLVAIVPDLGLSVEADTNLACSGDSVLLTATMTVTSGQVVWIPSTGLSAPNSAQTMAAPSSTTTYTAIASQSGCHDTASITLNILPRPEMSFSHSSPEGCAPLTVSFLDNSTDAIFRTWSFGDGSPVRNVLNPSHEFTRPGTYIVQLEGVSPGGCDDFAETLTITVKPPVVVEFQTDPEFPAELPLPDATIAFENLTEEAVSFVWDFGDGIQASGFNTEHSYLVPGMYYVTLHATDELGCTGQITHGPFVIYAPDLFIPNVFTPNDDNVSDLFLVEYTGDQPFLLQVFDRWGVMMFSTRSKHEGWDGSMEDKAPAVEGAYFYKLRIGQKDYAGSLSLVR